MIEALGFSRQGCRAALLPGDETPVCTGRWLFPVRESFGTTYSATGSEVVGISTDSVESHKKFAAHHDLPLRLRVGSGGDVGRACMTRKIADSSKVDTFVFL